MAWKLESSRLVPFPLGTNFPPRFKMADLMSFLCVSECFEDFEFINDLVEDDDDVILFSAVSCFTRRNLTRNHNYSEVTIPRYLPDEFKNHFRITRETCELLLREIVQTGNRTLGNLGGRDVIAPKKQVLFLSYLPQENKTSTDTVEQLG